MPVESKTMTKWNTVKGMSSITIENDRGVLVCLYPTQASVALTNTSVHVNVSLAFVNVMDHIMIIIV